MTTYTAKSDAMARDILGRMSPIDLFDYLADYTDAEPHDDAAREPTAMLAAVLADIAKTGPDVFCDRMDDQVEA